MTDAFVINYINEKMNNVKNTNYIVYTFYELKIKNNLSDEEIDRFLKINKDYFENNGYNVYFTGARFTYKNTNILVQDNQYMIAVKDDEKNELI